VVELAIAAVWAVTATLLRRRRGSGAPNGPRTRWRPSRIDMIALAIPAVVGAALGYAFLGRFRYPPGWDAMNHAVLTRNIMDSGSTAITSACTTGSFLPEISCRFYPLAGDVSWAQAALLSGGHVSTAMTAWSAYLGPVALVVAVFTFTRAMGARPVVSSCAAMSTLLVGPFWASELIGRITEQDGPGFSIAVALLVAVALHRRRPLLLGVLAGVAGGGLLMTHTYEILFVATLGIAAAATMQGRVHARAVACAFGAFVGGGLLTILPFLGAILGASSARSSVRPVYLGHPWEALEFWVTDLKRYVLFGYPDPGTHGKLGLAIIAGLILTVPCLVASPLCFAVDRLRWGRPWVLVWAFWTAIGIFTASSGSSLSLFLNGLWYGNPDRLRVMIFPVYGILTVVGACVIGQGVEALLRRPEAHGSPLRSVSFVGAAASVLVILLLVLAVKPGTTQKLRADLATRSPKGAAYTRVYQWLAAHTTTNDATGYNRNLEFMTWAYADDDVRPLIGIPPLVRKDAPHYRDMYLAWHWLVGDKVPPEGCLVRKYHLKYVVTGAQRIPGVWPIVYNRRRLAASPNVDLVHQDGGIKVYQVNTKGEACATA
jgi:hypothetical protein